MRLIINFDDWLKSINRVLGARRQNFRIIPDGMTHEKRFMQSSFVVMVDRVTVTRSSVLILFVNFRHVQEHPVVNLSRAHAVDLAVVCLSRSYLVLSILLNHRVPDSGKVEHLGDAHGGTNLRASAVNFVASTSLCVLEVDNCFV